MNPQQQLIRKLFPKLEMVRRGSCYSIYFSNGEHISIRHKRKRIILHMDDGICDISLQTAVILLRKHFQNLYVHPSMSAEQL